MYNLKGCYYWDKSYKTLITLVYKSNSVQCYYVLYTNKYFNLKNYKANKTIQLISNHQEGESERLCLHINYTVVEPDKFKQTRDPLGTMNERWLLQGGGEVVGGGGHPGADRRCWPVPLMRYDYRHTLTLTTNWRTLSVNNAFTILPRTHIPQIDLCLCIRLACS